MAISKEAESGRLTADKQAMQEVNGYIERVEKQMETKGSSSALKPVARKIVSPKVSDDSGNIVMQAAQQRKKLKIVLPLDEDGIKDGLHHKVFETVRWLAEWCVLMIKKYPGRVFYKR